MSRAAHGTLFRKHYRLKRGKFAKVGDVLKMALGKPCPEPHQPENVHLVRFRRTWKLVQRDAFTDADVRKLIQSALVLGPELLGSRTDRVSLASLSDRPLQASLALVHVRRLTLEKTASFRGNPQLRAIFVLGGQKYDISVTDPAMERQFSDSNPGLYPISEARGYLLTVSLGRPFEGQCFKLVAAIIPASKVLD